VTATVGRHPSGGSPLRVLMLAFEFPPLNSGGVHRALGFARELPLSGVDLDIVTVKETDYPDWTKAPIDRDLMDRLPGSERVHRISSGFPQWYWRLTASRAGFRVAQYLHWGDPVSVFWRRPLLELLDRLVAERRPDVLLATAPPFGVAVLAREIARRYRLPWVVDFRDAWSRWCVAPYPSLGHYLYARRAERRILREANASVATSHVTRSEWLADNPTLDVARLLTIYNGFDVPSSHAGHGREGVASRGSSEGLRQIIYVGSFYYTPDARAATFRPAWRRRPDQWLQYRLRREDWLYRSPYFFLRGLERLASRQPELAAQLRVTFAGPVPSWLPSMLAETGTSNMVSLPGIVSHAEALAMLDGAAAALLTSAKVEGGRDYSIAGKLYEYFAARVPILALVNDGAMRDLVLQSGLGLFADPDDTAAVAEVLARIAAAPDPRGLVTPNDAFIRQFDRRLIANQMADSLRRAAAEGYRE
jgi:glycosyltransferase involved in cell wall biosynthesis